MESLELGPPPPAPRQRQLLVLLGVAGVVLALLAFGIVNLSRQSSSAPTPSPSLSPTASEQATPTRSPAPTATPPAVRRWSTDGFLSDLDLDLYVRADNHLYRIQTATRRVTATTIPQQSGGPLTFVVDGGTVIVRDWNSPASGFVLSEGRLPQDLPSRLSRPDQVFPGPPGRLWLVSYDSKPAAQLTDLTGHPVRAAKGPSRYEDLDGLQPDGRGGLLLSAAGGLFAMTPDGPRRITRGTVLATGPNHVLTTDCTATLRCSRSSSTGGPESSAASVGPRSTITRRDRSRRTGATPPCCPGAPRARPAFGCSTCAATASCASCRTRRAAAIRRR